MWTAAICFKGMFSYSDYSYNYSFISDLLLSIYYYVTHARHMTRVEKHVSKKMSRLMTKSKNDCTPNEDLDQPFFMQTAKTLIRLGGCPAISVFAGRTCHFVGFVMRGLKYHLERNTLDPREYINNFKRSQTYFNTDIFRQTFYLIIIGILLYIFFL